MTKQPRCIDAFCGAGGLSLGLIKSGFKPVLAFDNDPWAVETYQKNIGSHVEKLDVKKIDGEYLKNIIPVGELDLFAGGPPCQGFSKQRRGAHKGDDIRNFLVLEFSRLVKLLKPKYFLLENVSMFGQKRGKEFVKEIKEQLVDYSLIPHFYNSADYGIAQTRERFIIVGQRNDLQAHFSIPSPTVKIWVTVGEVLKDLPEPPIDYSIHPEYPNHQRARVTEVNINRFSYVPQGGGWKDIPEELRLECHRNVDVSKGGWPDVYGRLELNGQAPTITGGFDSFTRGRYGHPTANRPLTPREAARLQSFPDYFEFIGTRQEVRKQIGNAVPPLLAEAIGKAIFQSIQSSVAHYSLSPPDGVTKNSLKEMAS